MASQVYDPETNSASEKPTPSLGPGHDRAAGDPSDPRGEGPDSLDNRDLNDAETNPTSAGEDNEKSSSLGRLRQAEDAAGEDDDDDGRIGKGYDYGNSNSTKGSRRFRIKITKRRAIIGAGIGGGVAGLAISSFFFLLPLKIEHIVTNLQGKFNATSESAVRDMTQTMVKNYFITRVLPSYRRCGTTVHKGCTARKYGSGPIATLYNTWADARLENKLADKNIEFRYDKSAKSWYLKAPGTPDTGDPIGANGEGLDGEFKKASRAEMRATVNVAIENETSWKKIMYRYKYGRLLEEKYGVKRCIIFCGTRDALRGRVNDKKIAAKIYLVQRVLIPRTESLGIVMQCLLSGCNPTQTDSPGDSSNPCSSSSSGDMWCSGGSGVDEIAGTPESENDRLLRERLTSLANEAYGRVDKEAVDKMVGDYKTISEKGYDAYLVKIVLEKVGLSEISNQVSDAVPVLDWISVGAQIINGANHAGPSMKKLSYAMNASAAVSLFMMYRSYADEIHTGHVDPTETGSMVASLGPGNSGTAADPQVGGTAGAENTPLYSNIIDRQPSSSVALLDSVLPGKASAAAVKATGDYKCKDGKSPSNLVCPEEKLGQDSAALNTVHEILNTEPLTLVTKAAGVVSGISSTVGKVFGAILDPVFKAMGVDDLTKAVGKIIGPTFKKLAEEIIPSPFATNMSGGRTFDMAAAGADVSGNDYAHIGLGGKKLTPVQVAAITNDYQQQEQEQFAQRPFFARMFSTDTSYSLVSRVAMSMPLSLQPASQETLASLVTNPLGVFEHGFASVFSGRASAASQPQEDPLGVNQYGYTQSDMAAIGDPETYWNAHCSNDPSRAYQKDNTWNNEAANYNTDSNDDPSGMPVNTSTNPCLLIVATVGSAGGQFNTNLLTPDDLADQGGLSNTSTSSQASATVDTKALFDDSSSVACAANTKDLGLQDGYHEGQKVRIRICAISNLPGSGEESNGGYGVGGADGDCVLNSRVSGVVYAMAETAKQDGLSLRANSCFRTMTHQQALCPCDGVTKAHPGYSNHQMGLAIDFTGLPSTPGPVSGNKTWDWLDKNASKFGYNNYPKEAWHWSPTGN